MSEKTRAGKHVGVNLRPPSSVAAWSGCRFPNGTAISSSWPFWASLLDAADFALFGAALPPIAQGIRVSGRRRPGFVATVGLVGAFLGALFWGTISDYIGRRTVVPRHDRHLRAVHRPRRRVLERAVATVFRFMSNFGLGGEVPVTLTMSAEFSPGRHSRRDDRQHHGRLSGRSRPGRAVSAC